ncbi:SacI homology domain-containing protein [Pisolithus marmoratus]|nr:SacI homology domain-containing protein [Pisolithus marmoratus]
MSHLHPYERIVVTISDDGLLMRPRDSDPHDSPSCVRVSWGRIPKVEQLSNDGERDWSSSVVIYGIIGILDLFNASYLLVITARRPVGSLLEETHIIHGVKDVSAIPLVKDRAQRVLTSISARALRKPSLGELNLPRAVDSAHDQHSHSPQTDFAEGEGAAVVIPAPDLGRAQTTSFPSSGTSTPASSESATVLNRFPLWTRLAGRNSGISVEGPPGEFNLAAVDAERNDEPVGTVPPTQLLESKEEQHAELEDRVVRECIREYTKGCMFFSYHCDLTRSLQHKHEQSLKCATQDKLLAKLDAFPHDLRKDGSECRTNLSVEPFATLPLWRRVDRQFWWNEYLSRPFIDTGLHSYVLPIVQGNFQIANFHLPVYPEDLNGYSISPVDYIIASRRSRHRAGLRYQRRGVDDEAFVANFVETETIIKVQRDGVSNVFSFVQIRGSIPLFWKQSGYSLKPPPTLAPERTLEQNMTAMRRHFQNTVSVYGPHMIVNLAEQKGKEGTLCGAYKAYVNQLNSNNVNYCEFDFHHETRGMKYERLSSLVDRLERTFESQGYFWVSNDILLSEQKGVFRVNCIDCLDRTNVVQANRQSTFARHVLEMQLGAVGLIIPGQGKRSEVDVIFNGIWANNGDVISRAYSGTSALKVSLTTSRTGKRDIGGLLNDGVNSLTRLYSATFSDWFCQAVIDFMLGHRTLSVFTEFLLKLQSTDPGELMRLSRIRTDAVATSVSLLLEEGETLFSGWTVFSPDALNTKLSDRFEEKVLLLSARALYIVSYDYTLDKVKQYTRVPLERIVQVVKGAYIISSLEEASRDPIQNAGFLVSWLSTDQGSSQRATFPHVRSPSQLSVSEGSRTTDVPRRLSSVLINKFSNTAKFKAVSIHSPRSRIVGDTFAAFKVLPIDPARIEAESTTTYGELTDDLAGATTCREVVDLMVGAIKRACYKAGAGLHEDFVVEEDVVSLDDAKRATSMYAKMEYSMKRLLWLGG